MLRPRAFYIHVYLATGRGLRAGLTWPTSRRTLPGVACRTPVARGRTRSRKNLTRVPRRGTHAKAKFARAADLTSNSRYLRHASLSHPAALRTRDSSIAATPPSFCDSSNSPVKERRPVKSERPTADFILPPAPPFLPFSVARCRFEWRNYYGNVINRGCSVALLPFFFLLFLTGTSESSLRASGYWLRMKLLRRN